MSKFKEMEELIEKLKAGIKVEEKVVEEEKEVKVEKKKKK